MVAEKINSIHTEIYITHEEAIDVIPKVIECIESWDTTTIRASVGQYLACKYISENTDFKVILVGEGPDEICSSYLFNWKCPSSEKLHETAKEYDLAIANYKECLQILPNKKNIILDQIKKIKIKIGCLHSLMISRFVKFVKNKPII